jgi:hypothetical protein
MIEPNNPLEKVILKSILKHGKDVCLVSEGTVQMLAYDVYEDCKKAAKKDDSLYLELYL